MGIERTKAYALLAVLACSASEAAQPIELRGLRLGMSESEAVQQVRVVQQAERDRLLKVAPSSREITDQLKRIYDRPLVCTSSTEAASDRRCVCDLFSVGGISGSLTLLFIDKRLGLIGFTFNEKQTDDMVRALAVRHGPANKAMERGTMWNIGAETISVLPPGGGRSYSALTLSDKAYDSAVDRRRSDEDRRRAKAL